MYLQLFSVMKNVFKFVKEIFNIMFWVKDEELLGAFNSFIVVDVDFLLYS